MMKYDISAIDMFGNYISKSCKTKKTAMKYVKEFCKAYRKCNLFVWKDGEIVNCDIFTRKI